MAESDLDYAKVTGRFGLTTGDTDDAGDNPDVIWCDEGTVEITPLITFTKVPGGSPDPFEAGNSVITATISADGYVDPTAGDRDGAGYITFRGKPFVVVLDLTSAKVNPRIGADQATHRVTFKNLRADGTRVDFPPRLVRLTTGGPDGDGVNELTRLLPVVAGESSPIFQGPQGLQGVSVESALITEEGELRFGLSDETEISAGDLPAAVDVLAAADTATTAATTATTKAGEASTSATAAAGSASGSATSAGAASTAAGTATTAKTAAETARDAAIAAKVAAEAVPTTSDTIIAGRINDPASATTTALSASIEAGADARIALIPNVVFEGDSMSASGVGSTALAVNTYNDTMPALAISGINPRSTLYNNSSFGKQLTTMISGGAANIDTRYSAGKRNVCVLWGGTNDLGLGGASAATVLSRIATFVSDRRAAGWRVITATLLPRSDGSKPAGFDANRATINAALVANAGGIYGDIIANPAADTVIGDDGDSASTVYYTDGLHMTVLGYFRVALAVRTALVAAGIALTERGIINPMAPSFSGAVTSLGIGYKALSANTGNGNTAFGSAALSSAVTGGANTGIGSNALAGVLGGTSNTGVGFDAGLGVTTGSQNTVVGALALIAATTAISNTAIGYQSMRVTTGSSNTALGNNTLLANTTGSSNVALGDQAMAGGTGSSNCVAAGSNALGGTTGAGNNIAIGSFALRTSTGSDNTAVGHSAGYQAGGSAGNATTTGARQVNIGSGSGQGSATQRNDTVAVGYRALVDAADTVALGSGAQALHSRAVALGKGTVSTAADQVAIDTRHIAMKEVTDPGVAAADGARLFAVDNGAGKTQLVVRFQTGTAIVLATEA